MDHVSRGLRNVGSCFWRQAEPVGESDSKVEDSESDSENPRASARDPWKPPYCSEKEIRGLLVRGDDAAKDQFVEYYLWCVKELKEKGDKLLDQLDKLEIADEQKGMFNSDFTEWEERHCVNDCIKGADAWSREKRENFALWNRRRRGVGEGGNPPEKSKDIFSTAVQRTAYIPWSIAQWCRTVLGGIGYYGQARGVYPRPEQPICTVAVDGTHVNGTLVDGTQVKDMLVNGTVVNGTLLNPSYFKGGYFNGTHFNGTSVNGTGVCGRAVNGTAINETHSADVDTEYPIPTLDDPQFYEYVSYFQLGFTAFTELPYLVHAIPQFRQYAREKAEKNKAHDAALSCARNALRYMTKPAPKAAEANAYVLAMQSWRRQGSKVGQHDVDLRLYSSFREIAFFFNLHCAMATSANLVSGQNLFRQYFSNQEVNRPATARLAGSIQGIGGLFGVAQYSLDIAQGWNELASATEKLKKIRGSIKNLKAMNEEGWAAFGEEDSNQSVEAIFTAKVANRAALAYMERQQSIEVPEQWYARIRMAKGAVGWLTGGASVYYGFKQLVDLAKSPLDALFWSLASTNVSAWYYKSSHLKMKMREDEKVLKKKLYQEAQFIGLNCTLKELAGHMVAGTSVEYVDYQHLFQNGKLGVKMTREAQFAENEYLLRDLLTDNILFELNNSSVEQTLQLPLVQWLDQTWKAPLNEFKALLETCTDRAPMFRRETLSDVLVKQLRITPQTAKDGREKKIKPSVLVLAKMKIFCREETDWGISFERIKADYKENVAAEVWTSDAHRELLLKGTTLEELISSVLHIYKQSSMPEIPADLLDEHIKFAKLLAVVEHAQEIRFKGLNAVATAKFEEWQFPRKAKQKIDLQDFGVMRKQVSDYLSLAISDRGEQARALKKLASIETMKTLLGLSKYKHWKARLEERDKELFVGLELLTERVDRNQPVLNDVFASPRARQVPAAAPTMATSLRSIRVDGGDGDGEDPMAEREAPSHDHTASEDDGVEGRPDRNTARKKGARRGNKRRDAPPASTGKRQKSHSGPKRSVYDNDGNDFDNAPKVEHRELSSASSSQSSTTSNKTTTSGRRSRISPLAETKSDVRERISGLSKQSTSPRSWAENGSPTHQTLAASKRADATTKTLVEAEDSDSVVTGEYSSDSSANSSSFSDS